MSHVARQRLNERIGDAERSAAADQLSEHFSAGRVTAEEFDERLEAIMAARTTGELWRQLADLPVPARKSPTAAPVAPRQPGISATTAALSVSAIVFCLLSIMGVALLTFGSMFTVFSIGLAVAASTALGYGLGVVQSKRRDRREVEAAARRLELDR